MTLKTILITSFLSILPISELRGAIPYALANRVPLPAAFILSVVLNAMVGPLLYLFLSTAHSFFLGIPLYKKIFGELIERAREKVHTHISRYGYLGIVLFVAIPLPVTGAYTGTLGAWVLGMEKKKTFLAVAAGVLIAGVIVTVISFFGIEAFSIFIKHVK